MRKWPMQTWLVKRLAVAQIVVLTGCGLVDKDRTADEAVVMKIAIAAMPSNRPGEPVILDQTGLGLIERAALGPRGFTMEGLQGRIAAMEPAVPITLIDRMYAANEKPTAVAERIPTGFTTVSQHVLDELFASGGWEKVLGSLSAGFYEISAPGFVDDFAIVHVSYSCGGLCGRNALVILRSESGVWVVREVVGLGIS